MSAANSPSGEKRKLKILVVDDNVDSAKILGLLLKMQGHEVKSVFSANAALEAAAEFVPQAVLLDIGLPVMNGYEVAKRLRELPAGGTTAIIAVSGYSDSDHARRAEDATFDETLVKPVEPKLLVEALLTATAARARCTPSSSAT